MKIPFNKPLFTGKECRYIQEAVNSGKISGDGKFSQKCHDFFENRYGFIKALLTTSCTDALEMAAILINIQPGDEVIMPSYTFVSTANAFVLRGAKIVFVDSRRDHPGMDEDAVEPLINSATKAIVAVHYAGIACDMDKINFLAEKYGLYVIEDAAQGIEGCYKGKPLGSLGNLAAFSFHETKNIISGEGGLLAINDEKFIKRAEIIREKGTNRSAFFRGEVDKYGWVDIGSSFLPSDIIAAFLYAQLENIDKIQHKRHLLWQKYYTLCQPLAGEGRVRLPDYPEYASNNAHLFYMVCRNYEERNALISFLRKNEIIAVFHYLALHKSPYYSNKHDGRDLEHADYYSRCLMRLPMFYELAEEQVEQIVGYVKEFYALQK